MGGLRFNASNEFKAWRVLLGILRLLGRSGSGRRRTTARQPAILRDYEGFFGLIAVVR